MKDNKPRLLVWAEYASFGLWEPLGNSVENPWPVRELDERILGLSPELTAEFDAWTSWFYDCDPSEEGEILPQEFIDEGFRLAKALAQFVGKNYQVEYEGQVISVEANE